MKKKKIITITTLILTIVLIAGVGLYANKALSPTSPVKESKTTQEESQEASEKDTETNTEEESFSPFKELSKEFKEAIQSTVSLFTSEERHIVAIGDSLTQGVGDNSEQGGYVGILDKHLNADKQVVTFENYGKRGNRSDQLLKRLNDPEIAESITTADIVIITIGANDIMQVLKENFTNITYEAFSEERGNYEQRLQQIFKKLNELNPEASVYLVGFYNPFEQYFHYIKELDMIVDDWNNTSKQIAEENGATFIPTKDLFMSTEEVNLFADDHFHPNSYGYQLMAKRILNYLVVD